VGKNSLPESLFYSPTKRIEYIFIKNKNKKKVSIIILEKILHIIEKKIIIKTSPFFYE